MRPPIRWFWSRTCARLAKKALKTAETLVDILFHKNLEYIIYFYGELIPQGLRCGVEGLVDLVVAEQQEQML